MRPCTSKSPTCALVRPIDVAPPSTCSSPHLPLNVSPVEFGGHIIISATVAWGRVFGVAGHGRCVAQLDERTLPISEACPFASVLAPVLPVHHLRTNTAAAKYSSSSGHQKNRSVEQLRMHLRRAIPRCCLLPTSPTDRRASHTGGRAPRGGGARGKNYE